MVVNPRAAAARALLWAGELADVALVVVRPHDRHIVRNAQAGFVEIEDLVIENDHLRDFRDVGVNAIGQDLTLVGENALDQRNLLGRRAAAFER